MLDYSIDKITQKYTRNKNSYYDILIEQLSKFYNNNDILLLTSGQHANMTIINIIILKYIKCKINILYYNDTYYESKQLLILLQNLYNINLYEINSNNDIILLLDNIKDDINILFIESCSNPYGNIFNFDIIKNIKSLYKNIYIICDNTWLTHKIFNPLDYDVDIITSSLTKHYSINKVICGFCLINKNKELYELLDNFIKMSGIHISIYSIKILINNLKYVDNTITKLSNMTKKIIKYLENKNIIICHPMLENHINYKFSQKYFKDNLYPSTFLIGFKSKTKIENIDKLKLKILNIGVSFCSYKTKIDPLVYYKDNISYLRLSIGSNDNYTKIIKGIDEFILLINH